MTTIGYFAKKHAATIMAAVWNDGTVRQKGVKSARYFANSHLAEAFRVIGQSFDGLANEASDLPTNEDHRQTIVNEIARRIGWNYPSMLRRLIEAGQEDNLLARCWDMEELFVAVNADQRASRATTMPATRMERRSRSVGQ